MTPTTKTKWRPEGWENPYPMYIQTDEGGKIAITVLLSDEEIFEAGADAMLEKLGGMSEVHLSGTTKMFPEAGDVVFIPEE